MKQILGEKNQSDYIDPEKAYFIEKFGYLVKNINSGYGGPIQDALIKHIFSAVDQFRVDLPDVVRDIEINRLKNLEAKKRNFTAQKTEEKEISKTESIVKPTVAEIKKEEIKELIPEVLEEKAAEVTPQEEQDIIETEIEIPTQETVKKVVEEPITEKKQTILRPSAAAIIEENRQRQLRKVQEQKLTEQEQKAAPLVMHPNVKPKKDLTVWERAWHRYGGYTDDVMNGHS